MLLSDFDFELPPQLIAQHPVEPRDAARLLQVHGDGLADRTVRDLPDLLRPGDLLVVNDTRVLPARLLGRRGEAGVEVTLHKAEGPARWRAFARPAKRLKPGDRIVFAGAAGETADQAFEAEVLERHEGEVLLAFSRSGPALIEALERHGTMPLPPYIKRAGGPDPVDRQSYQTVFARQSGAVAAPTAGLHFTPRLLEALAARGVERTTLTLHVGAGTFLPVKHERVEEHRMHAEWASLSVESAAAVARTRARGGRVVAVGTTALRTLESAALDSGAVEAFEGETSLFILPGFRFRAVDLLVTNFHLPRSTLFMLVAAFSGLERMRTAYAHAVAERYRFFSYGDACLLERQP